MPSRSRIDRGIDAEVRKDARVGAWLVAVLLASTIPIEARGQLDHGFDGTYLFAGGEAEKVSHRKSLETAVEELNPLFRRIGLRALGQYLRIPRYVVFKSCADRLTIVLDPFPPRHSTIDGAPSTFKTVSGDPGSIRRVIMGRSIVETVVTGKNRRVITYSFDESYTRLTQTWHVEVPRYLKKTIRFKLSYRRRIDAQTL